jgi:hypothetical protein
MFVYVCFVFVFNHSICLFLFVQMQIPFERDITSQTFTKASKKVVLSNFVVVCFH